MWFANERPSNSKRIKIKIMAQKTHVVVLGNGFDKYLGRPTSYKEFYDKMPDWLKYYPAPLIQYLEECYPDDKSREKVRWYDLENSLYDYYNTKVAPKKVGVFDLDEEEKKTLTFIIKNSPYYFENAYDNGGDYDSVLRNKRNDVIARLIAKKIIYLDQRHYCHTSFPSDLPPELLPVQDNTLIESSAERDKRAFMLIKECLYRYLSNIPNRVEDKLYASTKIPISPDNKYLFFSFNYTPFPFDKKDEKDTNEFYYVHGSCYYNNIILGTRECDMVKEYRFLQKTFDPNYQPASLAYSLLDADEVTIFGHSLGTNDRQYFEGFFKRQCSAEIAKKGMPINIYTLNEDSIIDMKRSLQELTNYHLSDLMQFSEVKFIKTK